jgi:endonuclease III
MKEKRFDEILAHFREKMPDVNTELEFGSVFQLLVAVVLSAQCTDKRVNMVTPELFKRYPTVQKMAAADVDDIRELIRSVSYPNSKAQHLKGLAEKLVSDFGGEVPGTVEDLMTLPGVGRKTANVVASLLAGAPVVAVDTHVFRVSHRIGLSRGATPYAVEQDLERHIPKEERPTAHHWLLLHGRYVCTARNPKCGQCPISSFCKQYAQA